MTTFAPFQPAQPHGFAPQPIAGMSSKPKRKRSFENDDDEEEIDAQKVSHGDACCMRE